MDYKEKILAKLQNASISNIYQLYSKVHEIEMDEFRNYFFDTGKDIVCFKKDAPMVTITAHEEPLQMLVVEVRAEGGDVVIVCDNYGTINTYNLCDVEKGHLDFLKDCLI